MELELTDKQRNILLGDEFFDIYKLAYEIGVAPSILKNYRKANGKRNFHWRFTPDINEFKKICTSSRYISEVARYYGVDSTTISLYSKLYDCIIRDTSAFKKPKTLSNEEKQQIIAMYNYASSSTLAEQYGVSQSSIGAIWAKAGLYGKTNRTFYLDEDYFEEINIQQKAYFLGLIGSDGCIYKQQVQNKQGILRFSLQSCDVKVLELFRKELKYEKPFYIFEKQNTYYTTEHSTLEISSNKMINDIEKLGLTVRKTYGNTIAVVPEKFMPDLIRGYFDGDGGITFKYNEGICVYIVGYKNNLMKIHDFLYNKNIYSTFTIDKRKHQYEEDNEFGTLVLPNKTAAYAFLKLIYDHADNFYIDRKFLEAEKFIKTIEESKNIRDMQIVNYYNYAVQKVS